MASFVSTSWRNTFTVPFTSVDLIFLMLKLQVDFSLLTVTVWTSSERIYGSGTETSDTLYVPKASPANRTIPEASVVPVISVDPEISLMVTLLMLSPLVWSDTVTTTVPSVTSSLTSTVRFRLNSMFVLVISNSNFSFVSIKYFSGTFVILK